VIVLAAFVAAIVTEDSQICSDKNVIVPRSKYITDENTPDQLQNRRTAFFGVVGGFDSHSLPLFSLGRALEATRLGDRKRLGKPRTWPALILEHPEQKLFPLGKPSDGDRPA
jgi:hypothetical protein